MNNYFTILEYRYEVELTTAIIHCVIEITSYFSHRAIVYLDDDAETLSYYDLDVPIIQCLNGFNSAEVFKN